jgi:hypothetical protein
MVALHQDQTEWLREVLPKPLRGTLLRSGCAPWTALAVGVEMFVMLWCGVAVHCPPWKYIRVWGSK